MPVNGLTTEQVLVTVFGVLAFLGVLWLWDVPEMIALRYLALAVAVGALLYLAVIVR
jgi:hypothetical protein